MFIQLSQCIRRNFLPPEMLCCSYMPERYERTVEKKSVWKAALMLSFSLKVSNSNNSATYITDNCCCFLHPNEIMRFFMYYLLLFFLCFV